MRKLFFLFIPLFWSCAVAQKQDAQKKYADIITEELTYGHMERLATEEMEGRGTGQDGIFKAAEYIAAEFEKEGLLAPVQGSYFQDVEFVSLGMAAENIRVGNTSYELGKDFYVQTQNPFTSFTAEEVIFIGYGIQEDKYNDLADLNIEGKVVLLVNEGEPTDKKGNSLIGGTKDPSEWGRSRFKKLQETLKLKPKLILSYDSRNAEMLSENRSEFQRSQIKLDDGNTLVKETQYAPILHISKEMANRVLASANTDIDRILKEINDSAAPKSQVVNSSFSGELGVKEEKFKNPNVLGLLEGTEKKDEVLVLTAHYDHDGIVGGKIFFGADDNASGTTGLMSIAKAFAAAKKEGNGPKRSILFIAFTGEEKGLLGSKYYVEHPIIPLENTIVNLNMDMIGRIDDLHLGKNENYIHTIGANRSSKELFEINEAANEKYTQMEIDYIYDKDEEPMQLFKRSDQYSFYQKDIPIIFYFSGLHPHYHTPEDTIDKIDFPMLVKRSKLIFHTTWEVANREQRLQNDLKK